MVDWDDEVYITENPGVLGGLSWGGLHWAWKNDEAPYWQPLTWLSFQFDAHCFSTRTPQRAVVLSPAAFHGQNLFWHCGSVLLLFGLLRRLTGASGRSFLVAALFAVHPMHVESVAWAIERKDVLSGFFGLLTLWAYVRSVERPGWKWSLATATAFLASLLSKPTLITLPFVLLLLDYWPLRRQQPFGRLVREKGPFFALAAWAAVATLTTRAQHGSVVSWDVLPLSARLANALTAYGWYVASTFCPSRLAILYPHAYRNWSVPGAVAGGTTLLVLTLLAVWQVRRRPWFLVGWLWFVGTLVPVIGLAQGGAQAWADRFSYWPHIGLFAAIVWGFGELADHCRIPALVCGTTGAVVLGSLAALTWIQVGYWKNSQTLWQHALAVTENNDHAHQHLAICYRRQGALREADAHSFEAFRIQSERRRALAPASAVPLLNAAGAPRPVEGAGGG